MRPPWLGPSREEAELEALQTDVMRFLAILGLCLAAIFSLVQGAAQQGAVETQPHVAAMPATPHAAPLRPAEEVNAEPDIAPATPPKRAKSPVPEPSPMRQSPTVEPAPEPEPIVLQEPPPEPVSQESTPASASAATESGFTLEFVSAEALAHLLRAGEVRLYAFQGERFWLVSADGRVAPGPAPDSYYEMDAATVPGALRSALAVAAPGAAATWGVTLPARAVAGIGELTRGREAGSLFIQRDGRVTID